MLSEGEATPAFLGEFKNLVSKHSVKRVVQEHLVSGMCHTMDDRIYHELRSEVASEWHIHPNEIIVVGSGKLGFSIKEESRFRPFGNGSDYDIAIICSDLFDYFWRLAFRHTSKYSIWRKRENFHAYMVMGWMRPDMLPSEGFEERSRWDAFFDELSTRTKYGRHKMKAGLYKSWEHLEAYQAVCVGECKSLLMSGFDLRLMSSVCDVGSIPKAGKNLVIVADVGNVLQFRIFDGDGKVVVDTDESSLTTQAGPIADLKKQLKNLWPPHQLTVGEKDRVITAVTSIVGHTLMSS